MIPRDFVRKWKAATLKERSAAQEHFLDLCELIGHGKPAALDPLGEWFCFEKGAEKRGGEDGFADVWKRGFDLAHKKLDEAVFAAYGWPIDLTDEQILERLLALNLERAAQEGGR
jgi:hypothetical protein